MAIFSVTDVASIGVVEDADALILPPNAWTGFGLYFFVRFFICSPR